MRSQTISTVQIAGSREFNWRELAVIVLCLVVLILGLVRQVTPQPYQAPDFANTYRASRAIIDGTNLYGHALEWVNGYQRGQPLKDQYFYAPAFALLMTPVSLLPYQAAYTVWASCLLFFLCFATYALIRSTGLRPRTSLVLALAAAASMMSAVRAEYFLGQANIFMLACIATAIWARQAGRPGLAGIFLALALVTKPMLLLISGFLLWKREFKFALTTIVGFFVLLLTPFLWLGRETLLNLLTLWHFYSSQYLSFSENISVRGMLERLFTVNPFVRPIVEMPALAVALWLAVFVTVLVVMLAVVAPRPVRRENRTLLEFGLIVSGLLLVSPLAEPPYLVLLIIAFLASFLYLRAMDWKNPPLSWAALVLFGLWVLELVPRHMTEDFFWARTRTDSLMADVYVTLAPTHFYILLATFLLQLHLLRRASGRTTAEAVKEFVRNSPWLLAQWIRDAASQAQGRNLRRAEP